MSVMEKRELEALIKDINDDDLKHMFNSTCASIICAKDLDVVASKLMKYIEYTPDLAVGDMIKFNGKQYVVTLIYTDNSVDLVGEDGQKINTGIYGKEVLYCGKLDCFEDSRFDRKKNNK